MLSLSSIRTNISCGEGILNGFGEKTVESGWDEACGKPEIKRKTLHNGRAFTILKPQQVLYFYGIIQIGINEDTTAVFTNDDLFVLTDLTLALWRNRVVATAAGIAENGHNGQTIAVVLADTIIRMQ